MTHRECLGVAMIVIAATAALGLPPAAAATASVGHGALRAATTTATAANELVGWGNNGEGELGNGHATSSDTPVMVKLPRHVAVTQATAGCFHSLAVTTTGKVLAWGFNRDGQLGDGSTKSSRIPVSVKLPRNTTVTSARAGCEFSLALTSAGRLLAWGFNGDGELGDGSTKGSHRPVMVKLPKNTRVKAFSAGCFHALALTTTGEVLAWGVNGDGQLGDGTTTSSDRPVKVKLPKHVKVKAVSAGCYHSLALSTKGQIIAWGNNTYGQLGNGTTTASDLPLAISFEISRPVGSITQLSAGWFDSLALTSSGAVLAWGDNGNGQLGTGNTTSYPAPQFVKLPAHTKVHAIKPGGFYNMVLTTTGKILAWGLDADGELGDGRTTDSDLPVRVHLQPGMSVTNLYAGSSASQSFASVRRS
ncbi:MAG: RCC1 domain-containing protein [Streptosporangiaceae bacterium]